MTNEVALTVPAIPPSVNHYKLRTRRGITFVSKDALAFKDILGAIVNAGQLRYALWGHTGESARRKLRYELEVTVYFGKKGKGDGDNLWKCIADGLKEHFVIHSDAAVSDWIMHVRRDWESPRTEIRVRAL